MKSIFHDFKRAFNEANNTIFLEDESPTLSNNKLVLQAIIENFIFDIFAILILSCLSRLPVFVF